MNVIQIINLHRYRGGADVIAEQTAALLEQRGHTSTLLTRDSRLLGQGLRGKVRAFYSGIYSRSGRRIMSSALRDLHPDLVHIHDVYPFFSPWIMRDCRRAGVPVVMTCHDYRLTCPVATHFCNDTVCERCIGGREYWCILKNCRNNRLESAAYALRNAVARQWRLFLDNVSAYLTPTVFVKNKLVSADFPSERISVVPNMVEMPETYVQAPSMGQYAAYVGRFSPEKGIQTLLHAAKMTEIPVHIAGDCRPMSGLLKDAPANVRFLGELNRESVAALYRGARFLVFPSVWYETFGMVAAEAMSHGLPVIASNIGAIPEMVEDGVTGLLFEPGNADELAAKMRQLWNEPEFCRRMGANAREKVGKYNIEAHYQQLMTVYHQAINHKHQT